MEMEIQATKLFHWNMAGYEDSGVDVVMNQGGSSSGKTWGILQCLIVIALQNPNYLISVVSHSLPHLKGGAMKDFFELLNKLDYYHPSLHNKSNHSYTFPNGSKIEFFSASDSNRGKGPRRHILYVNECNLVSKDSFYQLSIRTDGKVFIDYNPSEDLEWLDKEIKQDSTTKYIHSTYKDNDQLSERIKRKLEALIRTDENYYRTYVLGLAPIAGSRIYSHFKSYTEIPTGLTIDFVCFGLDFGYRHPTALVKVTKTKCNKYFVEELLYGSEWTQTDLLSEMGNISGLKQHTMYCDSAKPDVIEELRRAGYKATSSDKSVKPGIDMIRSSEIFLHESALNVWKEFRLYSWKMQGERMTEEPVKLNDDAMDALRYAIHSSKKKAFNAAATAFY